jgi:hypothetical protein
MKPRKPARAVYRFDIVKPHGSLHPLEVANVFPTHQIRPKSLGNEKRYGHLTNESSYHEYAWEFLRRNRFFQLMQDARDDEQKQSLAENYPEELWAPKLEYWEKSGVGLATHHHYSWPYKHTVPLKDGTLDEQTVTWALIEYFGEQFHRLHNAHSTLSPLPEIDLTRIPIMFDLTSIAGNELALKRQLELVDQELRKLVEDYYQVEARERRPKDPPKELLRNYLKIVDLFSGKGESSAMKAVTATYFETLDSKENKRKSPQQQRGTISSWAKEAFKYVYEGAYLTLLAHDRWNVPTHPLPRKLPRTKPSV